MSTITHDAYRQSLFGERDDLFDRCLTGAAILGALFLVTVLIAPVHKMAITHVEQLPERFARLIIEKPKPQPAAPIVNRASLDKAVQPEAAKPEAPPAPTPRPEPVARRRDIARERPPDAGVQGRQRAQEATASIQKATATIDRSLAGLSSSLKSTSTETARPSRRRARSVSSGRGGSELGTVRADVAGGGADLEGTAVGGSLVAIGSISSGPAGGSADVSGGDPTGVAGSGPGVYRSTASLLAVVQKYAAGIQYCYGNELKHDPTLSGKLVVALTVSADGRVTNATIVQNSVKSQALASCALSQIREWRFPPIASGVTTFQAPFVFTPPR
jgi:TonB family protein